MSVKLITEGIWDEITLAVKKSKIKSFVAVAYFGQNGAEMLPLNEGSVLLVDASEKAVKSGQTSPNELLKLYHNGVKIYSQEDLHAKIFIIGKTLYVGSTNVSGNSKNRLTEAVIKSTDKVAIEDAKAFIESKCELEMGEEELTELQKIYVAPKNSGGGRKTSTVTLSDFYIYRLTETEYTPKQEEEVVKGRIEAEKNRITKPRHKVDEFVWTKDLKAKKGDIIFQITKEGKKFYCSPPGRLIYTRDVTEEKEDSIICFVEIPERKRKNLELLTLNLDEKEIKSLNKSGRKSKLLAKRLIILFGN